MEGGVACEHRKYMGYPYSGVDLREHPEEYRIGRGEQGVFHAEPYKGELLPLWKFKDEKAARASSGAIYQKFLEYRSEGDFVGMDVARKYLQMGWTRSLRYARAVTRTGRGTSSTRRKAGLPESSKRSGAPPLRTRSISGSKKSTSVETSSDLQRAVRLHVVSVPWTNENC